MVEWYSSEWITQHWLLSVFSLCNKEGPQLKLCENRHINRLIFIFLNVCCIWNFFPYKLVKQNKKNNSQQTFSQWIPLVLWNMNFKKINYYLMNHVEKQWWLMTGSKPSSPCYLDLQTISSHAEWIKLALNVSNCRGLLKLIIYRIWRWWYSEAHSANVSVLWGQTKATELGRLRDLRLMPWILIEIKLNFKTLVGLAAITRQNLG